MKTSAATISMVLVLLFAGGAQSQTTIPRQGAPGGDAGAPRRPVPARPPVAVQHPGSVRHPGFGRQPFFAQSPAFVRPARFPFRSGFVTNQIFIARGDVVAPWPYWYQYPSQAYAQPQYWAYCQNPEGYYPYVQDCPGGWLAVVPTPPAPGWWRSSPDTDRQPLGGSSTEELREQIARSRAESDAGLDLLSTLTTPSSTTIE
jgi:hypothetical protein